MSLGFYLKVIYSLLARSRANRVGFYMIPYIRVHVLAFALLTSESINFWCRKESHHVLDHLVRDGRWMAVGWEESLPLIHMTKYYCTNSYPAIFFHDLISCGWMKYWICKSAGWGGESVNCHPVTRLASDLGWTCQKYHRMVHKYICTVHIYVAYDRNTFPSIVLKVLLVMPTMVALSHCTGVLGCLWPMASRVQKKTMPV